MSSANSKPHLLFLSHRIPYPPNKGDKIRSYHLFRYLCEHYQVHLAAFVDDEEDWQHKAHVEGMCSSCTLLPLNPFKAKLRSLRGFLSGQALSIPYYGSAALRQWLSELRKKQPVEKVVVFSSAMAQYVVNEPFAGARVVIDFVDVDSDKWRQYAVAKPAHTAWIYRREARLLEKYDIDVAHKSDVSVFVSPQEAALFRKLVGDSSVRVDHMVNGVDTEYFNPALEYISPYPEGKIPIVFTGAMDYWANVDAVTWFCEKVLPDVRAQVADAVFYIVGSKPGDDVEKLAGDSVVVTGRVPDVRPYLTDAAAVVAPMRIARGIQNKVLEAMSMARPVVVSSKGLEGISAEHGAELFVADQPAQYARILVDVIRSREHGTAQRARDFVCEKNSWDASLRRFGAFVGN